MSLSTKVDVYSFGMCILEIVTRQHPYAECANEETIIHRLSQKLPPLGLNRIMNENARHFISSCVLFDSEKRPSVEELLNHPFLSPNQDEDDMEIILGPLIEIQFDDKVGNEDSKFAKDETEEKYVAEQSEQLDQTNTVDLRHSSGKFPTSTSGQITLHLVIGGEFTSDGIQKDIEFSFNYLKEKADVSFTCFYLNLIRLLPEK